MTSSMCAVHPSAPAVTTCSRCGRFSCRNCLQDMTCNDCVARAAQAIPPLADRAMLASFALWACAGMHGLMAMLAGAQLATGQTGEEGLLPILSGLVALTNLVLFIVTVVLVCMWFHRAARHALARGAQLEVQTPAAAVGSWFIPFVNLARPFNLARSMLVNADLDASAVGVWQGLWIIGNITANVSTRLTGSGAIGAGLISDVLMVGAGLTAAGIVRKLKWPEAVGSVEERQRAEFIAKASANV